ncbi:uncharacterized protein (DUF2252 family) [Gluconobacter cerinus]|uniref:DUF2252 domain-containing protein n=1 Tax=Gluconobacter cerinus TaxID=38307 RepID=UPI0022277901|nr:DUF2252 domain-containing protein [Gluconobacter cerinus]MCW2266921.1 uncharacterized protein (DUF2252 family) [Gluconobacter cerinus]
MQNTSPKITAHASDLLTRKESHCQGAKLRKKIPRGAHAEWSSPSTRQSPVSLLSQQGKDRIPSLLPVRYDRMKVSPFTFLRGAAIVMAQDLASTPASGIDVQSCGDCHLANFGSYSSPEGVPVFDINDFDETLKAPFEWDIKRLGTSLVLAGQENGLSSKGARDLAANMSLSYCEQMTRLAAMTPLQIWSERIDLTAAIAGFDDQKVRARAEKLLSDRLEAAKGHFGLIASDGKNPSFKEKPPLVMRLPEQEETIRLAFNRYVETQPLERAILLRRYTLKDVIFKVVGIGSVGTFCAIGLFSTADGETMLLQIKEAQVSVLQADTRTSPFANQGERVVTGQRIMQAVSDTFLGWTHSNASTSSDTPDLSGSGRQFYVRRVKDSRLAAIGSDVAQDGLADYAKLCGRTLARAHARSGNVSMISGYLGKGASFAAAVAEFSETYADQTHKDWKTFCSALESGELSQKSA